MPGLLEDFRIACNFLTRLPVEPRREIGLRDLAGAVYLFPVVGVVVGVAGALAYGLATGFGLSSLPAAVLAVATMVLITGALHEDGLADTADALGVGGERERALAVMRDSRIGTFGALALLLVILARVSALAGFRDPASFACAVVATAAASRAVMPVIMRVQPNARASGLAAAIGRPDSPHVWAGLGLALAFSLLLLPASAALKAAAATALVAAVAAVWFGRRFGGYTGDTLGAIQQLSEVAFLLALAREI